VEHVEQVAQVAQVNQYALVLHPHEPDVCLSRQDLLHGLQEIGLAGAALRTEGDERYLVGEQFFSCVSFLGCSPRMQLQPAADGGDDFCHLSLACHEDGPVFLGESNLRQPRCPACRQPVTDWEKRVVSWQQGDCSSLACQGCGRQFSLPQLDWRQTAVVSCMAIYIWNIHGGEAVPTDPFLDKLAGLSGAGWDYYYCTRGPEKQ